MPTEAKPPTVMSAPTVNDDNNTVNRANDATPLVVAYQGEPGSFSEQATRDFHNTHAPGCPLTLCPCPTFRDMFDSLSAGRANRIAVPIENSLAGTIHENLDLLLRARDAEIVGELDLQVRHCLVGLPGASITNLKTVRSHPMALAQCRAFLDKHGLASQVGYDTAGCAKLIAKEQTADAAAIASAHAASIYGLAVLAKDIQDETHNYTRFLFISNKNCNISSDEKEGLDTISSTTMKTTGGGGGGEAKGKTSIAFSLINQPGILCRALSVFAVSNIDLSKIESRHLHTVRRAIGDDADSDLSEKRWGYVFYVDILRRAEEDAVKAALNHLQQITTFYRLLGSYPAHVSSPSTTTTTTSI